MNNNDLNLATFLNSAFIIRGKYSDFLKIKQYILEKTESKLLFDKVSFANLIVKEKIPQEGIDEES